MTCDAAPSRDDACLRILLAQSRASEEQSYEPTRHIGHLDGGLSTTYKGVTGLQERNLQLSKHTIVGSLEREAL